MSGPVAVHHIEDPFAFARTDSQCSGNLALAAMPRLQDRLAENDGVVAYAVRGRLDERDRPMLSLELDVNLRLRCARCLKPLDYPLALKSRVLLSHPGEVPQGDEDPETPEWIEVEQQLDLLELIEDEILLGLPFAARHGPENCTTGNSSEKQAGAKDAPFAKLASLLEESKSTNKR